jgi:hypothetical protein
MTVVYFIAAAVLALFAVAGGEIRGLPFRRRLADASRSRLPATPKRGMLRR